MEDGRTLHGELTPLAPKEFETQPRWATWRIAIVVINALTYVVSIIPASVSSPLVPLLESDAGLGWTTNNSQVILSVNRLAEAVGLLTLAWLADAYGGATAMSWYLFVAACAMLGMAAAKHPPLIVDLFMLACFVRGIAWPAAVKILADHLAAAQWEVGICALGVASRFGSFLTSEIVALASTVLGWRGTICTLVAVMLLAALSMRAVLHCSARERRQPSQDLGRAQDEESLEAKRPPVLELLNLAVARCMANLRGVAFFFSMADSWLIVLLVICQQPLWAFGDFLGTFAYDVYNVPPSECATVNGAYPLGQALGLTFGLAGTLYAGARARFSMYIMIATLALGSAVVPMVLLHTPHSLSTWALIGMAGLQGFCCVLLDYVPTTVWAMHAGRLRGEGAHYLGLLYSIGYTFSFILNWHLGRLRNTSLTHAFHQEMTYASVAALASAGLLTLHIYSNRNGTLFSDKA